jgi:hypothetical protein
MNALENIEPRERGEYICDLATQALIDHPTDRIRLMGQSSGAHNVKPVAPTNVGASTTPLCRAAPFSNADFMAAIRNWKP